MSFSFIFNSIILGAGLAMDAFSVSVANGLRKPDMPLREKLLISGVFAFFQFLMPLIGWFCVHTALHYFRIIQPVIPWTAFLLLLYIGGGMIREALKPDEDTHAEDKPLTFSALILQGIATSIDALSAGFTIAEYSTLEALTACALIAVTTFCICLPGVRLGSLAGVRLSRKATIVGGCILIIIGIRVLLDFLLA